LLNIQLSRGMTSLTLLGAASAAACVTTLYFVGQARVAEAQTPHPVQLATPLATTVLSAEEFADSPAAFARDGTLKSRETLIGLVTEMGANSSDAANSLKALYDAELVDPRRVRAGLRVNANFQGDTEEDARLVSLSFSNEAGKQILSKRMSDGNFMPVVLTAHTMPEVRTVSGTITTSIYESALAQGAHDQQVVDYASILGYDVDFQRDIHPGDKFEIVYEEMVDERGNRVRSGDVLYASLNGRTLDKGYYRFTPDDDGEPDYFDRNGESATRFLMKTPINGARLSSTFGYRRHPISGYNKLHKGTDFAARTGTPVYAAGHGTVERSSRYGGYGNYVRIQHANGYETAYAHLSKYGPGIRAGKRVRQGDIIGYVGSTGASTGPHLHYEVLVKGQQVNAMALKLPTGRKLAETPDILEAFTETRDEIDAQRFSAEAPEGGLIMSSYEAPPAP